LDSFEFCKFQAHNEKAMAKDKKVNIAVTHSSPIGFAHTGDVGQRFHLAMQFQ
jgi:hypothetical protein